MDISCTENSIFSNLKPEDVDTLSTKIATFFYETNSQTSLFENKRLEIIRSLKHVCSTGSNLKVDEANYDCFVKFSSGLLNFVESDADVALVEAESDSTDVALEVWLFNKKVNSIYRSKLKFLDQIKRRDRQKYDNSVVFDSIYGNLVEDVGDTLLALSKEKLCASSSLEFELKDTARENCSLEKTIRFGYSLLNFPKNDICVQVLCCVLEKFAASSCLSCFQIDFLNYVWTSTEKLGTSSKVERVLLEHYSFIYEKQFIVLCTNVIKGNLVHNDLRLCNNILKICADDKTLLLKISDLCYELFACSNYNPVLYDFLIQNKFID